MIPLEEYLKEAESSLRAAGEPEEIIQEHLQEVRDYYNGVVTPEMLKGRGTHSKRGFILRARLRKKYTEELQKTWSKDTQ